MTPDNLAEAAVVWHARLREPTSSAGDRERFEQWLLADERHAEAYAEVERLFGAVGMPSRAVASESRHGGLKRAPKRLYWALAASMAGLAILSALWLNAGGYDRLRSDEATGIGETRLVHLSDGTDVTLNTNTAITHDLSGRTREVSILHGEAHFSVAHDSAKPFIVHTSSGTIRVVGTRFNVRTSKDAARVSVEQGIVDVRGAWAGAYRLTRGQQTRIERGVPHPPFPNDPAGVATWRKGQLVFYDTPLRDVAAELSLYTHGRVIALGDGLASQKVSGVFNARDPDGAVAVIERTLAVKSLTVPGLLTLLYRE